MLGTCIQGNRHAKTFKLREFGQVHWQLYFKGKNSVSYRALSSWETNYYKGFFSG